MTTITYLDIQRMSTEDGPGLRTTLFFKGCPLRCTWCHNPESISFSFETIRHDNRCIGCKLCAEVCPNKQQTCSGCMRCVEMCPTGAMEGKGTRGNPVDLKEILLRDRAYWGENGGVTLSGGEALAQRDGAVALLRLLKEAGVHTAVDTCGQIPWENIEAVLPYTDLFLYDIKLLDTVAHKRFTGAGNERVLENASRLHDAGAAMWIRTPIIPGATDGRSNIRGIASFISAKLPKVQRWELCAFNNLGCDKYKQLGLVYDFADTGLVPRRQMEDLVSVAQENAGCPVYWSGAVA